MIGALISLTLALAIIWPQSSQYGMNIALAYVWLGSLAQMFICLFWVPLKSIEDASEKNAAQLKDFEQKVIIGKPKRLRWLRLSIYIGLLVVMAAYGALFTVIVGAMAVSFYQSLRESIAEKAAK